MLALLHAIRSLPTHERAEALEILSRERPAHLRDVDAVLAELEEAGDVTARGRARIRELIGVSSKKTAADVERLSTWLARCHSAAYANAVCTRHAERSRAALRRAGLCDSSHADILHALIDFTIARDH
jgi:geranylgeranyl pyrophosphate synthase